MAQRHKGINEASLKKGGSLRVLVCLACGARRDKRANAFNWDPWDKGPFCYPITKKGGETK